MTNQQRYLCHRVELANAPGSSATITVHALGDGIATQSWKWLVFAVRSSHDSAVNGVSIEVSYDGGVTWDVMGTSSYTAANGWFKFKKHLTEGIMRIRYTNSANVLTIWRGAVYLSNEDFED